MQFKETAMNNEPEIVSEMSIANYKLAWLYIPEEFDFHATSADDVITRTSYFILP